MTSRPTGYCVSSMRPYTSQGKYIFLWPFPGLFDPLCIKIFECVSNIYKVRTNFAK